MSPRNTTAPFGLDFDAAILEELTGEKWDVPVQAEVGELGLALGSHIGLKRSRNEDRVAAARIRAPNCEVYTLAIVCDGVGGSQEGDRAAALAIAAVIFELSAQRLNPPMRELASTLVRRADDYVRKELRGRGTTTLCMFIASSNGQAACASVGDSRAYAWGNSKLTQITTDDTVENELKDLPGDHEALLNVRGLKGRLSQAIGEADRTSGELRVQVFPRDRFQAGILLGSDGLWKVAKDFEASSANSRNALDAVRRGITGANWVGGHDNTSILVIEDLERFCLLGERAAHSTDRVTLTLWTGKSKLRLFAEYLRYQTPSQSPAPSRSPSPSPSPSLKAEKTKRKPSKPRAQRPANGQMTISDDVTPEPKPMIEVTFGNGERRDGNDKVEGRE
jgi:serine/threonine protein phosphatase PrpC